MKRLVLSVVVLAVASVVLAACGGGGGGGSERLSKEDYSAKVASVGDALQTSFSDVATEAQAVSSGDVSSLSDAGELLDKLAEVVRGGQRSLEAAADELDAITPPEDAEDAHGRLVEGLRALADEFSTFAAALEGGELSEITDLATRFEDLGNSPAIATLQQATDELKAKGYDIEGE